MKFIRGFLLCVFWFLSACDGKPEVGQPAISADKMRDIILDIQLAEAFSIGSGDTTGTNRFKKHPDSLFVYYSSVLAHHGVGLEDFTRAMSWFEDHPEKIDSLFLSVIDELNHKKAQLNIETEEGESEPESRTGILKRK